MPMKLPNPTPAEAVALFRLGVVGDLLARELPAGELRAELEARAAERYRPPGSAVTRQFHWKTLQSWYYAAKRHGLAGLHPRSRKQGFGLDLAPETRELLVQIRREHPSAPAGLILETAIDQGLVVAGQVSVSTLRRLFADAGVTRLMLNRAGRRERRRWEAARVGALWHADVCHVRAFRVHGLLDDHSRYVPALEARATEREVDLLSVFCGALLRRPPPEVFYVDNGACYRGEVLALACARLGVRLVHAQPHDPQARGKMERFWRTLRTRCTDHLSATATLPELNAALLAFLDADYHVRPHAGLMGETPLQRFHAGLKGLGRPLTPRELAEALEVPITRRVAGDGTFSVEGRVYEVRGRHLAHRTIALASDPFTGEILRATYRDQPVVFGLCDPSSNRSRGRAVAPPEPSVDTPFDRVAFDPIAALLNRARLETP